MSQIITNAFANYLQACLTSQTPVVLDEFVLANIPGLDPSKPISPDQGLPPAGQIVHRRAVDQRGRINNDAAIIDFDSRFAGMIANQQHQGMSQQFTAAPPKPAKPRASDKGKKKTPFKPTDEPCTRSQAVRLRALGYKVLSERGKRRRYRKPSLKWIQAHVSRTRAAIIIRTTTGETRKNRWTVETPARPMLPEASSTELLAIAAKAFKKMGWAGSQ